MEQFARNDEKPIELTEAQDVYAWVSYASICTLGKSGYTYGGKASAKLYDGKVRDKNM